MNDKPSDNAGAKRDIVPDLIKERDDLRADSDTHRGRVVELEGQLGDLRAQLQAREIWPSFDFWPSGSELLKRLEPFAQGCFSGDVSQWPQLKPLLDECYQAIHFYQKKLASRAAQIEELERHFSEAKRHGETISEWLSRELENIKELEKDRERLDWLLPKVAKHDLCNWPTLSDGRDAIDAARNAEGGEEETG